VTTALPDCGIHRLVDHLQTGTVAELHYAARGVLRPGIGGIRREEEFEAAEESVALAATIWWNAQRLKPARWIPQGVVVQDGMKTEPANFMTVLQLELEGITTDINRDRHGTKVEGLIVNQDIVTLSNVLTRLQSDNQLSPVQIYKIRYEQGLLMINFYNAHDAVNANQSGAPCEPTRTIPSTISRGLTVTGLAHSSISKASSGVPSRGLYVVCEGS
jgi:hypothetical protein